MRLSCKIFEVLKTKKLLNSSEHREYDLIFVTTNNKYKDHSLRIEASDVPINTYTEL